MCVRVEASIWKMSLSLALWVRVPNFRDLVLYMQLVSVTDSFTAVTSKDAVKLMCNMTCQKRTHEHKIFLGQMATLYKLFVLYLWRDYSWELPGGVHEEVDVHARVVGGPQLRVREQEVQARRLEGGQHEGRRVGRSMVFWVGGKFNRLYIHVWPKICTKNAQTG